MQMSMRGLQRRNTEGRCQVACESVKERDIAATLLSDLLSVCLLPVSDVLDVPRCQNRRQAVACA